MKAEGKFKTFAFKEKYSWSRMGMGQIECVELYKKAIK
jgi:hypothetical protein